MNIGIDLDSTLAKIDQPWLDRLNRIRGTHYRAEDWIDWDLSFLNEADREVFFHAFTPDIYQDVEPYEGAREAIREIASVPGVTLRCVTTNPSKGSDAFTSAKTEWIRRHFPELSEGVVFSKRKFGLGLDVLVDDAPHHFEAPDYTPVLVERPWNRNVICDLRFREWLDGQRILLRIIQNRFPKLNARRF